MLETLSFKVVALALTATLALLLWQFAIPAIGYGASVVGADRTAQAVVEQCARGIGVDDGCVVRVTEAGSARSATLEHPGLFALGSGDRVDVALFDDGSVGLAGWPPLADAGLLTLLALAVTGYTIGWWRRVLEHRNPLYDGGDPQDDLALPEPRRRD